MSRSFHTIELNLPAAPGEDLPDPTKAVVTIDGKPFNEVSEVSLRCGSTKLTEVSITFYAEVKGFGYVESKRTWPEEK